jgi:hypothetical protein
MLEAFSEILLGFKFSTPSISPIGQQDISIEHKFFMPTILYFFLSCIRSQTMNSASTAH